MFHRSTDHGMNDDRQFSRFLGMIQPRFECVLVDTGQPGMKLCKVCFDDCV
jgi:hypothetical protein